MEVKSSMDRKRRYDTLVSNNITVTEFDNWSKEQFLYLKKNSRERIIVPEDSETMTQIGTEGIHVCFNFVADAFNELKEHYRIKIANGIPPYMGMESLKVKKSYIKPSSLFMEHMKRMETIFYEKYLFPERSNIVTFKDFMKVFMRFAVDYVHKYPIIFSSYVSSTLCPIHCTATVIELADVPHNDDQARENHVLNDSFNFFSRLSKEYGFLVPKHAPWSLIANLDSTKMQSYAIQYDALTRNQVTDEYFIECKDHDIDLLKSFLFNSYETFRSRNTVISRVRVCSSGRLIRTTTERDSTEPAVLTADFSPTYWYELYLRIRLLELKKHISEKRLAKLFRECYHVLNKYGFDKSFLYAEMKILETRKDKFR